MHRTNLHRTAYRVKFPGNDTHQCSSFGNFDHRHGTGVLRCDVRIVAVLDPRSRALVRCRHRCAAVRRAHRCGTRSTLACTDPAPSHALVQLQNSCIIFSRTRAVPVSTLIMLSEPLDILYYKYLTIQTISSKSTFFLF